MYGWWNANWQAWWQESLSDSYVNARGPLKAPEKQENTDESFSPQAATEHNQLGVADWPFDIALCHVDESLAITSHTENFYKVTGLCEEEKPENLMNLVRADARAHLLFSLQQVLLGDQASMRHMMRARLAVRPERWLHISGRRCAGEGLQLVLRDITQEMHLERELVRARINAELAQRARSEFLGRMSHELRTPLNAVIGFAQMIESEVKGSMDHPVYREYLGSILQSGEQLREKINNLLAISEAELGETEMQDEVVSLATLLRCATEHHQHFAFSKDVQLSLDVNVWSAPHVRIDKGLMVKALSNLVENAIASTPQGGSVRLECAVSKDGRVLVQVRDTGIGMTESLVRCLEDFFAGTYSSNHYYERIPLGTGLILTREYVQMHGGTLDVQSEKGNGAIFTICLPPERKITRQATMTRSVVLAEALAI